MFPRRKVSSEQIFQRTAVVYFSRPSYEYTLFASHFPRVSYDFSSILFFIFFLPAGIFPNVAEAGPRYSVFGFVCTPRPARVTPCSVLFVRRGRPALLRVRFCLYAEAGPRYSVFGFVCTPRPARVTPCSVLFVRRGRPALLRVRFCLYAEAGPRYSVFGFVHTPRPARVTPCSVLFVRLLLRIRVHMQIKN